MPLNEIEVEIIKTVVQRFLRQNEGTPRALLVRRYRSSQVFYQFTNSRMLTNAATNAVTGEEVYLPLSLAFHYSGDPDVTQLARTAVSVVLRILQNLFDVEMEKKDFKPADVEAHAYKIFNLPPERETLRLGLYLARDFGVLSSWSMNADQTELVSFRIAESVVEIRDFDKAWDDFIARSTAFENAPPPGAPAIDLSEADMYVESSDFGWPLIHPAIEKVAKTRFDSQHYADAAEAAFKLINERLKEIVRDRTGLEYDGVALMQKAFSKNKPVLLLGDLSTVIGEDMQVGYQQIFSGAMRGIRNPKAHANVQIDAVRAMHFIFLASLLMFKMDDALSMESSSAAPVASAMPSKKE